MTVTPVDAAATSPKKPQQNPQRKSQQSLVLLFVGLLLTMLMASLNQTVLATALPTIVGDLNGVNHMSWVITSFILASTITMPVYGRISDVFGRRPVILVAIGLFMIGSITGALASSIEVLIVSRVIQGLGGGGLMILSQAAIADVVPARQRGKYMGIMGAAFAVSSVAGPLLGGWLTEGPGWRWAFWINLPFGVLAMLAVALFLPAPKKLGADRPRLDYLGMALIAAATTALVLASTWGGSEYEWGSPLIIGLFVAAAVLAVLFVVVEAKAVEPVIPLSFFADRNFTLTTVAGLITGVAMFGALGYMPTYIQMVTGVGAAQAGLLMVPMMGTMLLTSVITGMVVSRTGHYKTYPVVGTVVVAGSLVLLSQLQADSAIWMLCGALGVMGLGLGMSMQIMVLIVQNSFPVSVVGTATAANNYFRQVGATLGSAVVGSLFITRLQDILAERMASTGATAGESSVNNLTPEMVQQLPDAMQDVIVGSYNEALMPIFLYILPLMIAAAVLLLFVQQKPLATTVEDGVRATSAGSPETGTLPLLRRDGADSDEIAADDAEARSGPSLESARLISPSTSR
ncbi:MDR family MFS transporter [Citricoccus sp. NR2]|uniref:MDR family MFS transporter n=1 Tax=Citricoccus sp. NR2 TaxID=3004095 RepID=UPI0022DD18BF|nr:MDR family MFS transporter [Citricoccus sp. NR2]WBL19257.1 MDR family MFS transporter [Citricoccus sp. NR2]